MTEHKSPHRAKPETWAFIEQGASLCGYDSCFLELRDRVEALEAAQQKATVKPATRLHSYRVENYALPIEEWGKNHTIVDSAKPPVTEDAPTPSHSLVELVGAPSSAAARSPSASKPASRSTPLPTGSSSRVRTPLQRGCGRRLGDD